MNTSITQLKGHMCTLADIQNLKLEMVEEGSL